MNIPNDQFWTQSVFPSGGNEAYDRFGTSLTGGDFNGDRRGDLAIGTPNEDVGGETNRGKVNVLRGSSTGLTSFGSQLWNQDNLAGSSTEAFDRF
ncbi:integrin alpha, partial [Moorena sp. SIO3B2]